MNPYPRLDEFPMWYRLRRFALVFLVRLGVLVVEEGGLLTDARLWGRPDGFRLFGARLSYRRLTIALEAFGEGI